jgi:hypothetical protein
MVEENGTVLSAGLKTPRAGAIAQRFLNYVFVDVMWLGLTVALHLYWLFVRFLVLLVLHGFRGDREGTALQERFRQTYLDYRKQTWFRHLVSHLVLSAFVCPASSR